MYAECDVFPPLQSSVYECNFAKGAEVRPTKHVNNVGCVDRPGSIVELGDVNVMSKSKVSCNGCVHDDVCTWAGVDESFAANGVWGKHALTLRLIAEHIKAEASNVVLNTWYFDDGIVHAIINTHFEYLCFLIFFVETILPVPFKITGAKG